MSNNPYLAHYFGEALEDNLGDVAYDAAANFAYFPNAVHMSHRVFRPSKVFQPTPEVSGTGGDLFRSDGGSAADVLQSTPATEGAYPSSTLDIPPLRNYVLDKPPRPESGPEVPTDGDCEVTHLLRKDLLEPTAATSTDVEALEWDLMIEKSRAAIKQARELLTHECGPYIGAERVSSPQNYSTVLTPASPKTASSVTISAQTAGSDDNVASQFRFTEEDENWCPGSKDRNLNSSSSYASGLVEGPHPAPASGAEMGPMTNTKEAGELLSSPEPHMPTSTLPMTEVKAQTMTTPSQPLHNLPTVTEARCVLLTPNPNAAACLAKRLTRRPPPALAVSEEDFSTTSGAPAVVGKVNGETGRAIMYAESVPTPYQSVERNHRKKERSRKIDGTLVSSLGSVLEQFARSLQARGIGNGCRDYHDSNSWDANCVKLEPVQQTENELKEKKSKCGAEPNERRGRKHCIPPPQVLVGSAPLVGASCAFPGDHYGAFIRAVPTSELPVVNADFYSNVSRRASSVRRTGNGVAPAAPSYARPTESWLCKGVQLSGGEYGDNNGVIDVKEMSGGCP
ncbi:hypothetical protein, conserved [Trypanosoma brucei gambiense DAL972]|uniref:Uncharacterized protein n=1 Tax=Trypanosoma brucei gambiense (strain MHOM/CI/86/DAL972) TaxID=679716 RepID=C9ZYE5_TRYB9|nr:hypothetical protein, conserved [Trypanosoma brucei gambiense DAL972]CBH14444.1 hypothetical protein, conserved [Trypanosoma brucei gambiense DAL972]|eukprot:XP_011776710.1 hypothetical protein, conserved [Trypanosoma brucei gambiense DAL972]